MQVREDVLVIGAEDADELLAPRHDGAVEDARGARCGVPPDDRVAVVAPQDAWVTGRLLLPRHVGHRIADEVERHGATFLSICLQPGPRTGIPWMSMRDGRVGFTGLTSADDESIRGVQPTRRGDPQQGPLTTITRCRRNGVRATPHEPPIRPGMPPSPDVAAGQGGRARRVPDKGPALRA